MSTELEDLLQMNAEIAKLAEISEGSHFGSSEVVEACAKRCPEAGAKGFYHLLSSGYRWAHRESHQQYRACHGEARNHGVSTFTSEALREEGLGSSEDRGWGARKRQK